MSVTETNHLRASVEAELTEARTWQSTRSNILLIRDVARSRSDGASIKGEKIRLSGRPGHHANLGRVE